jgi:hypothetical protein
MTARSWAMMIMTSLSFTISSRLGYVYCKTKRRREAKIDNSFDYIKNPGRADESEVWT